METKHAPSAVYCDVQNCVYRHDDGRCTAGKLRIGPAHAISANDTLCVTFKPQAR